MLGESEPRPERRHKQPGRRATDPQNFAAGALVEAIAQDRLFPPWTREGVIKTLTLLSLAGAIYVGLSTWAGARLASRAEIREQVKPVVDTLERLKLEAMSRMDRIENRQDEAETIHSLIVPMARLQCLQMRRWDSGTLADAAGLPCDSLLRRIGR